MTVIVTYSAFEIAMITDDIVCRNCSLPGCLSTHKANYAGLKTLKGGSLDVGIWLRGSALEDLCELTTSKVVMLTEQNTCNRIVICCELALV